MLLSSNVSRIPRLRRLASWPLDGSGKNFDSAKLASANFSEVLARLPRLRQFLSTFHQIVLDNLSTTFRFDKEKRRVELVAGV